MKKFLFALCTALAASVSLAEGSTTGAITPIDMSGYTNSLNTWVTSFGPVLLGIAGAFGAIWLLIIGIQLVKRMGKTAK